LTLSRIAHGVPLGGELDLVDGGTLAHALAGGRRSHSDVSFSLCRSDTCICCYITSGLMLMAPKWVPCSAELM
jgi:hypothetical protein